MDGYVPEIDLKESEFDLIIGKYREPEKVTCSISSCHTPHNRGYIVTTKDNKITNIGVNCGNKHFGVEFENQAQQLEKDYWRQETRRNLNEYSNNIEYWQNEIENISNGERGASWLIKENTVIMKRGEGLPESISKRIYEMQKTQNNMLTKERLATDREREIYKAMGQNIQYMSEDIGIIHGLSGLKDIERLRDIIAHDLKPELKAFSELDIEQAPDSQLAHWQKWCSEVNQKISLVKSIIESANLFFNKENIALFSEVAENNGEEEKIMAIAKRYS